MGECRARTQNEIEGRAWLEKCHQRLKGVRSGSFNVFVKNKMILTPDTVRASAVCVFKNEGNKRYIYIQKSDDSSFLISSPKSLILGTPGTKQAVSFNIRQQQAPDALSNVFHDLFFEPLLTDSFYSRILNNANIKIYVERNGTRTILLKVSYPDRGDVTRMYSLLTIDKEELLITKEIFFANAFNDQQITEVSIHHPRLNHAHINDNLFDIDYQLAKNRLQLRSLEELYKENDPGLTLTSGNPAPAWSLTNVDKKVFQLDDYRRKIIILDFWYMSCYPCLKTIPVLNQLYQKYKAGDKIEVLSINTDKKHTELLPGFIDSKHIKYPVLLGGDTIAHEYHVRSYPTLFIINKGIIAHVEEGYYDGLLEKISRIVDSLLTK